MAMANRKDYTMDVLRLLDQLKAMVYRPKVIPFMRVAFGYDPDDLAMHIEKVRAHLPRELKDAASLNRESERILETADQDAKTIMDQAKREAERLLTEAKVEADRTMEQARIQQSQMVADSEVLKLAKAQAEEIRNAAERDSLQMRRGADKYAYDVLCHCENVLTRQLQTIERGKVELAPPETAVVASPRDRTKVQ